jgi:hypothetical protein
MPTCNKKSTHYKCERQRIQDEIHNMEYAMKTSIDNQTKINETILQSMYKERDKYEILISRYTEYENNTDE